MKVLVVGGGGREHALAWKLNQSERVETVYCAPGNPGTATFCKNIDLKDTDITGLSMFVRENKIDLTVVGPEAALVAGIVDRFTAEGLAIFGPTKRAAQLEGSKSISKRLMRKYKIPTAAFETFHDAERACQHIDAIDYDVVVKAVGLAAGKGVIVADDKEEAKEAVNQMIRDEAFGEAGKEVLIEERMSGPEISVLVFSDGKNIAVMPAGQDHKPAYDGGKGPNTGGMGAFCPSPLMDDKVEREVIDKIIIPTIHGAKHDLGGFKGILYFGIMLTKNGPSLLEYNVRFGDPECQPLMTLLKTDLVDIIEAVNDERLDEIDIQWHDGQSAVCVVMASGGYPGAYKTGIKIKGLDDLAHDPSVEVFHAGTTENKNGDVVTNGGRVLGVTAMGKDLPSAAATAYEKLRALDFEGVHYRTDIGTYLAEQE